MPQDNKGTPAPGAQNGQVTFTNENWRETLIPKELQGEPSLADFKSHSDVFKSYVSAQKMIGADKVAIPGDGATDDEWRAVFRKLGAPESPDGYTLEDMGLPEGTQPDGELLDNARQWFHEADLNSRQVNRIIKKWNEYAIAKTSSQAQASKEEIQKASTELRKEWGSSYDRNLEGVGGLAEKFGGKEFAAYLETAKFSDGTTLGNHPSMLRFLHNIRQVLSEDTLKGIRQESGNRTDAPSPSAAKAEIAKISGNPKHPYFNVDHPEHKIAVERMSQLFGIVHGTDEVR